MNNLVSFPGFNLSFDINPIAFTIAQKDIYWYGIIIAFGFYLATNYAMKMSKVFGLKSEDILDAILFATPISIICARIYYVAFSFDSYRDNLIDVFKIWEGGIAIYGAVIGGVLAFYFFAKFKKIKFAPLVDAGTSALLLGQAIGRWGNFVNKEAYGSETTSIFRMVFKNPTDMSIGYHPTFLYESIWNIIGFALLYIIAKKFYKFSGQIALSYMIWYGFGRGIIEGLRTDSLYFGFIRVSQLLGFITSVVGLIILFIMLKKEKKSNDIT